MATPPRLSPGDNAPQFALNDDAGNVVSLADFAGQRVIVYFYPAAMTPGCTKQACDFTNAAAELRSGGLNILGISPDSPEKLAKFRAKESLTITLLSDPAKSAMIAYGAFGEKQNYGKTVQGVIRSTFVIDADGKIEQAQYNVKAAGHVERLLKQLA
ncbi:MAG: thioredoxin-dependent thiol peroxidase [Antricoccus sp.]